MDNYIFVSYNFTVIKYAHERRKSTGDPWLTIARGTILNSEVMVDLLSGKDSDIPSLPGFRRISIIDQDMVGGAVVRLSDKSSDENGDGVRIVIQPGSRITLGSVDNSDYNLDRVQISCRKTGKTTL